ncbi:MAG: acyl-CoA dehydrogenase [Actinophytocola sp.]|nr:acyl-CoA dehydrogenase [Actinophytocola sp.]
MSDDRSFVAEAATSILQDHSTPETVRRVEHRGWNEELWSVLAESGFTTISVPETAGGSGGDIADACVVIKAVGQFAAAVPVVETALLAGWALAAAGLELPIGPATTGVGQSADTTELRKTAQGWRLSGRLHRVPWAHQAERLVLIVPVDGVDHVVSVRAPELEILPGRNLAGETRDTVVFDDVPAEAVAPAPPGVSVEALRLRGALGRAVATAGALARVADLTVQYTAAREQFGRPLARFQAVQRHIVRIAERTQAAGMAADTAALNADPDPDFFDVAAAKIIAGESGSTAAAAAHQAHGAIGMTKEYELGQLTRRLWTWRDEFGSESYWSRLLGQQVVMDGASELWPRLSTGRVPHGSTRSQA